MLVDLAFDTKMNGLYVGQGLMKDVTCKEQERYFKLVHAIEQKTVDAEEREEFLQWFTNRLFELFLTLFVYRIHLSICFVR